MGCGRSALTIAILHNQFWVSNDHNMSLRMSAKFAPKEAKKAPAKDPEVRTKLMECMLNTKEKH